MSKQNKEHVESKRISLPSTTFEELVQMAVKRERVLAPKLVVAEIVAGFYPSLWQQGNFTIAVVLSKEDNMVVAVGVAKRSVTDPNTDTGPVLALSRALRTLARSFL